MSFDSTELGFDGRVDELKYPSVKRRELFVESRRQQRFVASHPGGI